MQKESFRKIPEHAKCVFRGVLFEVWQWQQKMFDGSFATFETIKRNDTVNVLAITKDKKIIINFEEQPHNFSKISLPCGQINENEKNLEGAKRELQEETGFTSNSWESWKKVDVLNSKKIEWNAEYFIARDCEKTNESKLDAGEKIEIKLLEFEDFLQITQEEKFPQKELAGIVKVILNSENIEVEKEKFRKFLFGEK